MNKEKMTEQENERAKRETEEIAKSIEQLPQRLRDRIAGAVSFAQLAATEKAV